MGPKDANTGFGWEGLSRLSGARFNTVEGCRNSNRNCSRCQLLSLVRLVVLYRDARTTDPIAVLAEESAPTLSGHLDPGLIPGVELVEVKGLLQRAVSAALPTERLLRHPAPRLAHVQRTPHASVGAQVQGAVGRGVKGDPTAGLQARAVVEHEGAFGLNVELAIDVAAELAVRERRNVRPRQDRRDVSLVDVLVVEAGAVAVDELDQRGGVTHVDVGRVDPGTALQVVPDERGVAGRGGESLVGARHGVLADVEGGVHRFDRHAEDRIARPGVVVAYLEAGEPAPADRVRVRRLARIGMRRREAGIGREVVAPAIVRGEGRRPEECW